MAKWIVETYATAAALEAAIELIDTTASVQVIPYHEGAKQVFKLIKPGS